MSETGSVTSAGDNASAALAEVDDPRLGSYEALLFAVVLENAMLQLRILEGCATSQKADGEAKQKLFRDRGIVCEATRATFAELLQSGRYPRLRTLLDGMKSARAHAAAASARHSQLLLTRAESAERCRSQRAERCALAAAADARAAELQDTLEDEAVNSNVRVRYVSRWQRARAEEPALKAQLAAPPRCDARQLRHEERVHVELTRAIEVATQEVGAAEEQWRARYHADVEDINQRLLERRQQLRDILARRQHLEQVYDAHAAEMRGWLTFKRERAARVAREERRAASATRLQAWWRAVMVRRGLGAFKALRAKKPPAKQTKKKA